MIDWFKFYWLKLKLLFHSKKRMARSDVNGYDPEVDRIGEGAPLHNEKRIADQYYALGEVAFSKWLNLLIPMFFVLLAMLVWHIAHGIPDWKNDYYFLANLAALLVVIAAIGVVSHRKPIVYVSEEEYRKAREWLHYMGEDEDGRGRMGLWKIFVLALGLGLEAWAIGVVVAAAATANQISERAAEMMAVPIGAAIAILLAWSAHHAGG